MDISRLDHVNIRTRNMEKLKLWYERVLGLKEGYRPPFGVDGMWLYSGDWPMVHLLYVSKQPPAPDPQIEHFAFRATGLSSFLAVLKKEGVDYRTVRVPEMRMLQIFFSDPDGNNMHVDFPPDEADAEGL